MSIRTWFRTSPARRGLAAGAVILAVGGLVLARTGADARVPSGAAASIAATGSNAAPFSGPGLHGVLALSHTKVLAGGEQRIFAELTLIADRTAEQARERAPLALAIVLDTSGSMSGDKIEDAKRSAIQLIRDMRDDDEIAFVRYSSDSEVIQPLTRVGAVRHALTERIQALAAGGGTNIPPALGSGLAAISDAGKGRVQRVVLVSDGLDSTRAAAEAIARDAAGRGITISSMGIGLDFDEAYMGGVARAGHGNFAFVKDADALATFLQRELKETAATTVERASARLKLPPGVRLVHALGADARALGDGGEIELHVGSLFAGDERRVVLELAASVAEGEVRPIDGRVAWDLVGGEAGQATVSGLSLAGSADAAEVEAGRDARVFASGMSAVASRRQIAAAEAYAAGDQAKADALITQNMAELRAAATAAPPPAAAALERQMAEYKVTQQRFSAAKPKSADGKAAAKTSVARDLANEARSAF